MEDLGYEMASIWGYSLSYLEFAGFVFGVLCVYLAARESIWTWGVGLVNIGCLFLIFYRVRLYADMFLQVYFFVVSLYGWANWAKQRREHIPISVLSTRQRWWSLVLLFGGTFLWGYVIKNLHLYLPFWFDKPAAFPFIDSFVAMASVLGTIWMARRILENWVLWVVVDVICVCLYLQKHILFIAVEYALLLGIASYGLWSWWRMYRQTLST